MIREKGWHCSQPETRLSTWGGGGGKEKSRQDAGNEGLIFCNKTPEGRLQNCSATSGDIKKQLSKSSLNGVIKGCLFRGEPRTNLSTQWLLSETNRRVHLCSSVSTRPLVATPTESHPSPNQQRTRKAGRALPVDGDGPQAGS